MQFASDPAGDQVVVWVEQPSPFRVMAAFRPAGGVWGAAQTLDATATTLPKIDVSVDNAGNFIVLFTEVIGANKIIYSSYQPSGSSSFDARQQLGSTLAGAVTPTGIAVALDPASGRAYAVIGISGATGLGFTRPAGSGSAWTATAGTLPSSSGNNMDMVVGTDGVPTLLDAQTTPRFSRYSGSGWSTLTSGAATGNLTLQPTIKADPGGQTTAVYGIQNTVANLQAQSCPAGTTATCAARTQLAFSATTAAAGPSLGTDASGNAVAAWTEGANVFYSQRSGPLGAWTPPVQIGAGATPSVAIDTSGTTFAAFAVSQNQVRYMKTAIGASPVQPALAASDPAQTWNLPLLASDAAGNVLGAWESTAATAIQSAVYDAEPPATPVLTVPSAATAGSLIDFAAASSDRWSGVSYAWAFGDGSADSGAKVSHAYAAPGSYVARVTATDRAGNSSSQTRTVTVAAAPVPGLPRPVAGGTVNLEPVSGDVLVEVPGSNRFVPLVSPTQVKDGSIIDARRGRVRITIDNGKGGLDSADFYGGVFKFTQPKVKAGQRWFANLYLVFGNFKGCARAPKSPKIASAAAKNPKQGRSVRRLWGSGKGAFRTVGRFSSATVRGTTWLTDDRCQGTLTKVTSGKVGVRDFVLDKTVLVKKGKSYFAQPKGKK